MGIPKTKDELFSYADYITWNDEKRWEIVNGIDYKIISPGTVKHDFGTKLILYQKFAVKEYWIVDPSAKTINVYITDNTGKYNPERIYEDMDEITPARFPDLKINLSDIFGI